jgi:transposase
LRDALGACTDLHPVYRRLLTMTLDELDRLETHIHQLDEELAQLLREHQAAVQRLAAVPGLGSIPRNRSSPKSVRPPPPSQRRSVWPRGWAPAPGHDESAGVNHSRRFPHGNRQMRRLFNQAANAAVKTKGSIFELVYRRLVVRLGHAQAIGAIAHRLCRLVWKILHDGITDEERGPAVTKARAQRRATKMIRELRSLGYRVEPVSPPASSLA